MARFDAPILFRVGTDIDPFKQQINDMYMAVSKWAADLAGTMSNDTLLFSGSGHQKIDSLYQTVRAAYETEFDPSKAWGSPMFPLWDSCIRIPKTTKSIHANFTFGVTHKSDIKLFVLDSGLGWVERTIKWNAIGDIDCSDFVGFPVLIVRRSTVDANFPYDWSEQRVQDEKCIQVFRYIQDHLWHHFAKGLVVKDIKGTTPFTQEGIAPPSILQNYASKDSVDDLSHRVGAAESAITNNEAKNIQRFRLAYQNDKSLAGAIAELNSRYNGTASQVQTNTTSIGALSTSVSGLVAKQGTIDREIANLKQGGGIDPDRFVSRDTFNLVMEQVPTKIEMNGAIHDAVEGLATKEEVQKARDLANNNHSQALQTVSKNYELKADATRKMSEEVARADAKYVAKTEVEGLKRLEEHLGKVDITSFATRSQLAQQQQNIESWGNSRFELKGAAYNLINDAKHTITTETDTKVNGLSNRIGSTLTEVDKLRQSTRQNLDALSGTVSVMDTRLTNGIGLLRHETDTKINNRLPKLSASDGMILVADNALAEKWKSSHYSLSIDNLIKERDDGYILNGTGRMTDGTGRGGFEYSTVSFSGSDGSFLVPTNQPSERNIFFGDRIRLKEPVFKFSFDAKYGDTNNNKAIRFNIRWFDRGGRELSNYLRGALSAAPTQFPATHSTWVVAPTHAEFCEVGIVNASMATNLYLTNVKVQFANDIPEETLWHFILGENFRPAGFGEDRIWIRCYISTHNTINVQGIVNNPGGVTTGRSVTATTNIPAPFATPYFNLNSPFGGMYLVDNGGLKLEARFNMPPAMGIRMGTSFKSLTEIRTFPFNTAAAAGTGTIRVRPLVGLNNNGTSGY